MRKGHGLVSVLLVQNFSTYSDFSAVASVSSGTSPSGKPVGNPGEPDYIV